MHLKLLENVKMYTGWQALCKASMLQHNYMWHCKSLHYTLHCSYGHTTEQKWKPYLTCGAYIRFISYANSSTVYTSQSLSQTAEFGTRLCSFKACELVLHCPQELCHFHLAFKMQDNLDCIFHDYIDWMISRPFPPHLHHLQVKLVLNKLRLDKPEKTTSPPASNWELIIDNLASNSCSFSFELLWPLISRVDATKSDLFQPVVLQQG